MIATRGALLGLPLAALAALWPWGVLTYVPGAGVTLTSLAVLAVIAAGALTKGRRFPLEYLWPGALVILFAALHHLPASPWRALHGAGLTALFLAIIRVSLRPAQALALLRVSAVSAIGMNLLSVFSLLTPTVLPTAYPGNAAFLAAFREDPYPFCGPMSLAQGAFINLCAFLVMAHWLWRGVRDRQRPPLLGLKAAGAAVLLGPGMLLTQLARHPSYWDVASFTGLGAAGTVALLVLGYLIARTWAKLEIAGRDFSHPHARFLQTLLAAATLYALIVPLQPRAGHAFLLALLASSARPYESTVRLPPAKGLFTGLLAVPLLLINAAHVFSANQADPRNYEPVMRRSFAGGDHEYLRQMILYIRSQAPEERRVWLWTSRLALALRRPYQAAAALNASASPPPPDARLILPPPETETLASGRARIRDYCSALPDPRAHFAYETTLIAAGEGRHVVAALKLRLPPQLGAASAIRKERYTAPLIAWLLGDSALAGSLQEQWTSAERATLLQEWGVEIAPDAAYGALACMYRDDALAACAISRTGAITETVLPQPLPYAARAGYAWRWTDGERPGPALLATDVEGALFEARLSDGMAEVVPGPAAPLQPMTRLPDAPAISVNFP